MRPHAVEVGSSRVPSVHRVVARVSRMSRFTGSSRTIRAFSETEAVRMSGIWTLWGQNLGQTLGSDSGTHRQVRQSTADAPESAADFGPRVSISWMSSKLSGVTSYFGELALCGVVTCHGAILTYILHSNRGAVNTRHQLHQWSRPSRC